MTNLLGVIDGAPEGFPNGTGNCRTAPRGFPPCACTPVNYTGVPPTPPMITGLLCWQCMGCGRIYNMTVSSCDCQMHRWSYVSDKITLFR